MKNRIYNLLLLFSEKHLVQGIKLHIQYTISRSDRKDIKNRIVDSVLMIKKYSPIYFDHLKKDITGIIIFGNHTFNAQYIVKLKLIDIYDEYVLSNDTTIEQLSSTIVHEAQHARLFRLGFGYEEYERERIEKLCRRAERKFGHRIPNGSQVIENADSWLKSDFNQSLSNEALQENKFQALRELNVPKWIIKLLRLYFK